MSLIDANSYDFSSGHYCYSRKNRGQSYTASSVWCQNSCNNFWLPNNWLAIGVPLGFSFMAGLLQAVPSWLSSNNTNNNINSVKRYSSEEPQAEVKSKEEIELEKDDKTDREAVTKILNDAKIQVDNEILEAIVLKYPTMKAIPSVNLTIEQRVINYAKGLKFDVTTDKYLQAKLNNSTSTETYAIKNGEGQDEGAKLKNGYIQFAQEQIELYDNTDNDGTINLTEYFAKELADLGVNLEDLTEEQANEALAKTKIIFDGLDTNGDKKLDASEMASLSWVRSTFRPEFNVENNTYNDTTFAEWNNIDETLDKFQEAVLKLPTDKLLEFKAKLDNNERLAALTLLKENCGLNENEFDNIGYFFKRYDKSVLGFVEHLKENS